PRATKAVGSGVRTTYTLERLCHICLQVTCFIHIQTSDVGKGRNRSFKSWPTNTDTINCMHAYKSFVTTCVSVLTYRHKCGKESYKCCT
ncbi:unnamed protein product, partial [Brassica oleracea]